MCSVTQYHTESEKKDAHQPKTTASIHQQKSPSRFKVLPTFWSIVTQLQEQFQLPLRADLLC